MAEPNQSPEPSDKRIPLPVAIAILVGVALIGAAAIGWFMWKPAPRKVMNAITPSAANPRVARMGEQAPAGVDPVKIAREADLPDGAYEKGEGELVIKAGDAYAHFTRVNGADRLHLGFYSITEQQWDHGYLTQGVRRILADEAFARELKITPQQVEALRDLPAAPGDWPPPDRAQLLGAYARWRGAMGPARSAVGQEMIPTLREAAKRKQASDQRIMADRIARIRSILTEAQVRAINPIPRWELPGTREP